MMDRKEMREVICDALTMNMDSYLAANGFGRRQNSLDYKRKVIDGEQRLEFHVEFSPLCNPGERCRIYPSYKLIYPALNQKVEELVRNSVSLVGDPSITITQPIEFVIPRSEVTAWYASDSDGAKSRILRIRESLEAWVMPFLDEHQTLSSLTYAHEMLDPRFQWERQHNIYLAASYILQNKPHAAMHLLEQKFNRPGARKKYEKVFEHVAQYLS